MGENLVEGNGDFYSKYFLLLAWNGVKMLWVIFACFLSFMYSDFCAIGSSLKLRFCSNVFFFFFCFVS